MYFFFIRRYSSSWAKLPVISIHKLVDSTVHENNIQIVGWIQRAQKRGAVNFVHINDGLSPKTIQVVIPKEVQQSVPVGSAVKIFGSWKSSSGNQQEMELLAESVHILAKDADPRYAMLSPDNLRKKLHLRSKAASFASLLRLRSRLTKITHDFFIDRDFYHIDTPVFTTNDCEGAGETFSAITSSDSGFFGEKQTYLTVSGQLHLEAITSGISRVYTFSGAYRADKQQSSAHLTEFKMIEAEIAFCENLEYLLDIVSSFTRHCATQLLSKPDLLKDFHTLGNYSTKDHIKVLEHIAQLNEYPRISYADAINILQKRGELVTTDGLSKKNEAFLVEQFRSPVFVTNFPSNQKPFYMKRSTNGELTDSFDFLCPIVGELAGGSIREPSVDVLKEQGGEIDWYLECRKRGKPISGGFGIGFERLLQVLLGIRNIKDTIPFPRWFKHCQC